MSKTDKTQARLPRGFGDRGPAALKAEREMLEKIRRVYELYGFEAVETPFFEYTDALGKFLPDQDRPNAGVFSLRDDDEQWMSLRYDLTAPLARYVAENYERLPKPYRSYRLGYVFRNEKPGPGRFRQFMQFDADTVGSASIAADAENCMMFADAMEALGIPRGSYVVKVNNRKILDGVMEAIGIGGPEHAGTRLTVMRAIDKMDKFPVEEIRKLLGAGRWDGGEVGKGDLAKGAGLTDGQIKGLLETRVYENDSGENSTELMIELGFAHSGTNIQNAPPRFNEGVWELSELKRLCRASGYGKNQIAIETSVVRGLEYYTGPVYEVELTFNITGDDGKPVRFGSVGGGGRYDGLVGRFRNEETPATGISIGVSRLLAALEYLNKEKAAETTGPVVVTVMDKDRVSDYQQMVSALRNKNIAAELYLGSAGFKAQMKYADKRNSPLAIIQGSNEKERGVVLVKDLRLGASLAAAGKDRALHLEKQAEAQREVPADQLVATVQAMLGR